MTLNTHVKAKDSPAHSTKDYGGYKSITPLILNLLTPNDDYSGRTTPLASKCCILYIYSTNIGTEYFKSGIYCQFFLFKVQFVS